MDLKECAEVVQVTFLWAKKKHRSLGHSAVYTWVETGGRENGPGEWAKRPIREEHRKQALHCSEELVSSQ